MPEQDVNAGELNKASMRRDRAPGSGPVFWRANLGAASVCATLYASVRNRREPGAIDIESSKVKKALLSPPHCLSWR